MNFVNNWLREITLAAGVTECALDLPDGLYRLVVADGLGAAATRLEVVSAEVSAGIAELQRGLEGTADQEWGEGSVIHCTLTAGQLWALFEQIADLQARVAALEGGTPPGNALTDAAGNLLTDAGGAILTTGVMA